MLNEADMRDLQIMVDETLLAWKREFDAIYRGPSLRTVAGMAVAMATPEALAGMDPAAVEKIRKQVKYGAHTS